MSRNRTNNNVFWGFVIILIGILFLLDNFYIMDFGYIFSTFWPVILIAIGIKMLLDRRKNIPHDEKKFSEISPGQINYHDEKNGISENNVFGDVRLKIKTDKFSGGSVNNVFGDIKIDLSETTQETPEVKLYASGVFGDISISAPQGISLRVHGSCVAGDITVRGNRKDGIFPNLNYQDADYEQAAQKMIIQASLVFGSINVY